MIKVILMLFMVLLSNSAMAEWVDVGVTGNGGKVVFNAYVANTSIRRSNCSIILILALY